MVSMYCDCCQGRNYWLSERELQSIGDPILQEQALQAIELYSEGVEIRTGESSQMIFDEEMEDDTQAESPERSPQFTMTDV